MKQLEDLPYRFWPSSKLPAGVTHSNFMNVKSAEFKKSYTKRVNPVLKAAGFQCKSTTARRDDAKLLRMVWYGTGSAGGSGVVTIAAHVPGLPSAGGIPVTADTFEVHRACFKRSLELAPGQAWFDLGKTTEEALETADLMAEAFETQGRAYLEHLEIAEEILLGLDPGAWVESMTDLYNTFGLQLTLGMARGLAPARVETVELLARLHARAGNTDRVRRFVELGREEIAPVETAHPRRFHEHMLRFDKLLAGDLTFALDATEHAEIDRRIARQVS